MLKNILNKQINIKKTYAVLFTIISFLIVGMYYTYGFFVTMQLHENVGILKTSSYDIDLDIAQIKVLPNETITKDIVLTNTTGIDLKYLLAWERGLSGVTVYSTNYDYQAYPILLNDDHITIPISISNSTSEEVTINLTCQEGLVSDLMIMINKGYNYITNKQWVDPSLAKVDIDLPSNMLPVYYSDVDKTWRLADISGQNPLYEWYNYGLQKWANGVIVTNDSMENIYSKSNVGDIISLDDIVSMWVYIPLYAYEIVGNSVTNYVHDTNISFNTKDILKYGLKETCDTKGIGECYLIGSRKYKLIAMPTVGINGYWVSKFELSGSIDSITSVPNSTSLSNVNIMTLIEKIQSMSNDTTQYDLIDNFGWGSTLMLANSEYGKHNNSNYYDDTNITFKRIYNNNYYNGSFKTGCSTNYTMTSSSLIKKTTTTCISYDDMMDYTHTSNGITYPIGKIGPGASTTGNIYGVYDMSGGINEYVRSVYLNDAGTCTIGNSGYEEVTLDDKCIYKNGLKDYDFFTYGASYNDGFVDSENDELTILNHYHGDGIRDNYRVFEKTGLWYSGTLFQTTKGGFMLRGYYATNDTSNGVMSPYTVYVNDGGAYSNVGGRAILYNRVK